MCIDPAACLPWYEWGRLDAPATNQLICSPLHRKRRCIGRTAVALIRADVAVVRRQGSRQPDAQLRARSERLSPHPCRRFLLSSSQYLCEEGAASARVYAGMLEPPPTPPERSARPCLTPRRSPPLPRARAAEPRSRERTPSSRALFPGASLSRSGGAGAGITAAARKAMGNTAARAQRVATCWSSLRSSTHRLVFPRVARYGAPALVTAILVGVVHPAVLVFAAAMAMMLVAVSLLPEGHFLLSYAYMREVRAATTTVRVCCCPSILRAASSVDSDHAWAFLTSFTNTKSVRRTGCSGVL